MVRGMRAATRAVASALAMLVLLVYVFGIIMRMVLGDETVPSSMSIAWGSVPSSMWTLLLQCTFGDDIWDLILDIRMFYGVEVHEASLESTRYWYGFMVIWIIMFYIFLT